MIINLIEITNRNNEKWISILEFYNQKKPRALFCIEWISSLHFRVDLFWIHVFKMEL